MHAWELKDSVDNLTLTSFAELQLYIIIEPRHDKTNKVTLRPAKTQISRGIRPVWSESSLCTQWVAKDPSFLHTDSENSDQTGRMPRLIWIFAGRTYHFVGFVMRRLIWLLRILSQFTRVSKICANSAQRCPRSFSLMKLILFSLAPFPTLLSCFLFNGPFITWYLLNEAVLHVET